jgi:hypothetical protein
MTVHKIANFFNEEGYRWKFADGSYRAPTADEIDETIGRAVEVLADEPDNTQLEVGRLCVKKRGSYFDVFVLIQEIKNDRV